MKTVTIYSTAVCPYCQRAKQLLTDLKVPFSNVDLSQDTGLWEKTAQKYNWQTVPMIVIGEEFIGGFDDLNKLHQAGELMKKLQAD